MTRKYTTKLIEMMDEGLLTARQVADACLNYMSESDVEDMATCEGFIDAEEDQQEVDEDAEE